jgi:hypothetical protein
MYFISVAKGPKFWPQNTKVPKKIVCGRENLGPNFMQIYKKKGGKGAEFCCCLVLHQNSHIFVLKILTSH